ncbi:MAG: hypothetical protein UX08_C0016G0001 [Candidatus Collierbacteria bacterium GW2011_GWB1_45_35]|uniref:DUF11 domain-containing protein n=2 Tax=Candidatus Collieribacteriota TaxID=1752725 RepID=A0A837IHQ1_9BACT|nr:MAG: hypothetical protein UW48_C0006G0018 [Microgenomates group bacterium GW2011_GWC1_44_23]KKT95991.1 MAG: hypothetical protein UW96_C0002G0018 [Candidatus Collierbacteria bacterium GW2011_GWA1_45_15]KKU01136.1 MAG: hypothetical protein UX01_C0002G0102 [Candidatus Collierbacteria bacterium GW2011_GWB2_45_17]KKU04793.1 MAG: hypothetical protein UX08_C0016G0001 [Candidatus Collierbacteria bacterium GW2011_GWB1_45_35]HBC45118.1 hypothetical protein [Candidatus Collierbacteria bacterium]
MKKNKAILSIFLILVILLIGVATIFISSKVSQEQAIAPTAPESEPQAAEVKWVGSAACTVTATSLCVASDVITCNPDCPTACGTAASTISTCKNSCGIATTKACPATSACADITIVKKAFKNESTNKAGSYDLKTEISSATPGQTIVYAIYLKNTTSVAVTKGVYIKDSVEKDVNFLTFLDTTSACRYVQNTDTMGTVICDDIKLNPGQEKVFAFRVKASDDAVVGKKIENKAQVWYNLDKFKEATKDLVLCSNACGRVATDICAATTACTDDLEVTKKAYKYVGGTYAYTTEIDTVAKNQTFIYAITIENFGEVDVTDVNITDTLNGEKQDQLTFVDAKSGCTYSASDRRVKCDGLTVKAGEKGVYAFKVKVAGGAVNGDIIKNVAIVNAVGTDINAANELTISTVVGCDHTCTGDSECNTGLVCDTGSSKCRLATNLGSDTCSAPMAARPTSIRTPAPTRVVGEVVVTEAPLPTERPVAAVEPTALPEAGILDFPGVAAFGGGLMLAIIGILLAL